MPIFGNYQERSKIMRKWYDLSVAKQDELAKVLTLENGKPLKEAVGEIIYSNDYIEFYAEEAKRIHVRMSVLFNIVQSQVPIRPSN